MKSYKVSIFLIAIFFSLISSSYAFENNYDNIYVVMLIGDFHNEKGAIDKDTFRAFEGNMRDFSYLMMIKFGVPKKNVLFESSLEHSLEWLRSRLTKKDLLIFHISAHGLTTCRERWWAPWRKCNEQSGWGIVIDKSISFKSLSENLDTLIPKHSIYIIDSCFSGAIIPFLKKPGRWIFTATAGNEIEYGNKLFLSDTSSKNLSKMLFTANLITSIEESNSWFEAFKKSKSSWTQALKSGKSWIPKPQYYLSEDIDLNFPNVKQIHSRDDTKSIKPQESPEFVFPAISKGSSTDFGFGSYIDGSWKWIVRSGFHYIWPFKEGMAKVSLLNSKKQLRMGFIDKSGKIQFETEIYNDWDIARSFSNGLAWFIDENRKYGFINKHGKVIIKPRYSYATDFHERLAYACDEKGKGGFININGDFVIKNSFTNQGPTDKIFFKEGLAAIKPDRKAGYINKFGRIEIPFEYEYALPFSEGYASVRTKKGWGVINQYGNMVIEPNENVAFIYPFSNGVARFKSNRNTYGYLNRKGKVVINDIFSSADDFSEGIAGVSIPNRGLMYIDLQGNVSINISSSIKEIGPFINGLARVGNRYTSAFIDKKGFIIVNNPVNHRRDWPYDMK